MSDFKAVERAISRAYAEWDKTGDPRLTCYSIEARQELAEARELQSRLEQAAGITDKEVNGTLADLKSAFAEESRAQNTRQSEMCRSAYLTILALSIQYAEVERAVLKEAQWWFEHRNEPHEYFRRIAELEHRT